MKTVQVLCPDASMQSQIRSVLSEFELEGEMFDSVETAYNALLGRPPSLLVLSNRLTDTVSGLDLLHALKGKGRLKAVPIVLMGDVGEIDPILLKDLGIEEVILDPFDPQDLRLVLRRYFHPLTKPKPPSEESVFEDILPLEKKPSKIDIGAEGEIERLDEVQMEDISDEERQAWGMVELKQTDPPWSSEEKPPPREESSLSWKPETARFRPRASFEDLSLNSLLEIADEAIDQVLEEFANKLYEEMYEVFLSFTRELKGKIDKMVRGEVRSWVRYRMNEEIKKRIRQE